MYVLFLRAVRETKRVSLIRSSNSEGNAMERGSVGAQEVEMPARKSVSR